MASANQNDRPHRSSGIPREQRERERAERHAQRASAAAAAAAAGGQSPGIVPPSPALIRQNSRGKSGARDGRQSDLPSASNVAVVAGRVPNNTSSAQPQPKRASSNQPSGVATPGIYAYAQQNPYAQAGNGSYGANGTPDAYDSRNQSLANGQNELGASGRVESPRPVGNEDNRQQRANGEYMDHEEEDPNQKKGGFAKFMEILTCRCA
jgi:casein kinase 1